MKQYDTIIFDLDRTLIDSTLVNQQSFEQAFTEVTGNSCSRELLDLLPVLSNAQVYELLKLPKEELLKLDDLWTVYYNLMEVPIFPGVEALLVALKDQDKTLAVVTSRTSTELNEPSLKKILGYFKRIVTSDMVKKTKPDPEGILLCINLEQFDPSKTIYIGDARSDEQAAHAAGIDFGYASWDVKDQEPPLHCDLYFETLEEVKQLGKGKSY